MVLFLSTGVAVIRRSRASTHWLQVGSSAGGGKENGRGLGREVPVNVGAGPPPSWATGLLIRHRIKPLQASEALLQKWPLSRSGPSTVSTNRPSPPPLDR